MWWLTIGCFLMISLLILGYYINYRKIKANKLTIEVRSALMFLNEFLYPMLLGLYFILAVSLLIINLK